MHEFTGFVCDWTNQYYSYHIELYNLKERNRAENSAQKHGGATVGLPTTVVAGAIETFRSV